MTPSKDTLEATNPTNEAADSEASNRTKQDASRLRSDAVSLEVPVKVHGSRVKDVVMGTTPHTEPFEEQTSTMIVFPQGSVLRMSTPVAAGQMMVVTNLKSGHDAICRVVKVRAFGQGQSYVEIEFTHRQPGYWGVYFPSEGAGAPSPVAPAAQAAPAVSVEVKVEKSEEKSAPDTSRMPGVSQKPLAVKPVGQASKQHSAFAPIGSQEDVQPAASSTSSRARTSSGRDTDRKGLVAEAARKSLLADFPPAAPASPASSLSMAELQGDVQGAPAVSFAGAGVPGELAYAPAEENPRSREESGTALGRFAASANLGGAHAAREAFGSGLSRGALGISGQPSESSSTKGRSWFAIAASVVVLLAAGIGALHYLHMPPFGGKSEKPVAAVMTAPTAPPVVPIPLPAAVSGPASPAASLMAQPRAASAPVAKSTPPVSAPIAQPATISGKSNKPAPAAAASAPIEQKPAAKVPDMLGAMNAHPTARTHSSGSGQADPAPALDASAENESGELPALGASAAVAPPAPDAPEGPVRIRVGGAVKPPRLLSSAMPVYPSIARDTGIDGDIVIDTTIDASGNVTAMKVVSGPPVLRQAALDALRRWKYAPSMLNGQPIPVQMTVTVRFHRD